MIYLFEDRKGRQELYLKEKLDNIVLKTALIDCKKSDLTNYLTNHFSDAKAILFHSSYSFNDNEITKEDIKKIYIEKKIPFIYFSGGLNNNIVVENGMSNANLNSGDMYKNLPIFLQEYKNNNKINVSLLIYGEKYLLNSLLELQSILTYYFFKKSNDYILIGNDYEDIIDIIDVRIKEDELKEDKTKLLNWIETEREKQKLNKQTLLSQIQKLTDNY